MTDVFIRRKEKREADKQRNNKLYEGVGKDQNTAAILKSPKGYWKLPTLGRTEKILLGG